MRTVFTWPVGHATDVDSRRQHAPLLPALAYAGACAVGGAMTACAVAGIAMALRSAGVVTDTAVTAVAIALALVAVACECRGTISPLPERSVQVPRYWLLWRRRSGTAAAFGLMIGAGVLTPLMHAVVYVVAALILVAPSVAAGAAVGAIYGGTRGVILLITWISDRLQLARPSWRRIAMNPVTDNRALALIALLWFVTTLALTTQ